MTPPPACSGPFSMPGLCRPRAIQGYDDDVDSKDRGATLTAGINRRRRGLAAHPRTRRPKHQRRGFSGVRLVCALRALWQDGRGQRRRLCALAEHETDQIRAGVAQLAERQPSKPPDLSAVLQFVRRRAYLSQLCAQDGRPTPEDRGDAFRTR